MDATFEDVVKLAEQLDSEQQNLLIYRLRVKQMQARVVPRAIAPFPDQNSVTSPTRDDLIQETEKLRQTPVRLSDRLLGKYADPNAPDLSEEEFHAQMHAI